jgi:hypothetical protein
VIGKRTAARKAHEANGQQQIPVFKQTIYPQCVLNVVSGQDGAKVLRFTVPNGEQHVFPLSADAATAVGQKLTAPSVEVAGPGDMPPPPPGSA